MALALMLYHHTHLWHKYVWHKHRRGLLILGYIALGHTAYLYCAYIAVLTYDIGMAESLWVFPVPGHGFA